jgi:hypothetical protein
LTEFPAKKELAEMIADALEGLRPNNSHAGVVTNMVETVRSELGTLEQFNDAQGIYARVPVEIRIK